MHPEQTPQFENRRYFRLKNLGALAGGLAVTGAITGYNLIGGSDIGSIELLFTIPTAIGAGTLTFFILKKSLLG